MFAILEVCRSKKTEKREKNGDGGKRGKNEKTGTEVRGEKTGTEVRGVLKFNCFYRIF